MFSIWNKNIWIVCNKKKPLSYKRVSYYIQLFFTQILNQIVIVFNQWFFMPIEVVCAKIILCESVESTTLSTLVA